MSTSRVVMGRIESFDPKVKFSKNDLIVKIKYKTKHNIQGEV